MKVLGIILAVLMLSLSALVGILGSNKSFDLGKNIAAVTEGMTDAQKEALGDALPSAGRLKGGGAVGILAALASLGLIVVTFVKKPLIMKVGGAVLGLCVLAIILYPGIETGPMDGMAPRTQAMVAAVMALIGAAGSFLVLRSSQR